MKRFLMVCAFFPLALSAAITGNWSAKVSGVTFTGSALPQTVGVYANLTAANGTVTGTAGTAGATSAIQNVVLSGSTVTFTVAEKGGNTKFVLTDTGAPTLSGTVTLSTGQVLPVTLTSIK